MSTDDEEECSSKNNPMRKLEEAISIKLASSGQQQQPLSMEVVSRIEACLVNEIFTTHRFLSTLDHPPYAEMIYKAIEEMNKSGGFSNQAALSACIKSEYRKNDNNNLPWAHESLLSHHLRRLYMSGEIIVAEDGCYIFPKLKHGHEKEFHQKLEQNNDDGGDIGAT